MALLNYEFDRQIELERDDVIGYDDDEWSHSSDDGSGYSNEGHGKH